MKTIVESNVRISLLKNFFTVTGFLAFYVSQLFEQYLPLGRSLLLVIFFCGTPWYIYFYGNNFYKIVLLNVIMITSSLILISSIIGVLNPIENIRYLYFYFPIILGLLFSLNISFFIKLIKIFMILNMLAMIYEFYSLSYILDPTSDLFHFIGRAKGFISYSKEAGSFILVFTLLFIKNLKPRWFLVLLVSSILTGSRMSMIFVLLAIIFETFTRFFKNPNLNLQKAFSVISLITVILGFLLVYISLEQSEIIRNRLMGAFSLLHSSNAERVNFWYSYLNIFNEYKLLNILFGKPFYAQQLISNGAESAFLNLLTDGGLVAFSIYLAAIILIFFYSKHKFCMFVNLILLIASMQISRVALGFLDGTLLWSCFWINIYQSKSYLKNDEASQKT